MAEFSEVMRQWKRMCTHYARCIDCPMSGNQKCIVPMKNEWEMDFDVACEMIMSWAAEHPEPVYELWGEWFEKRGDLIRGWHNATNIQWIAKTFGRLMCTPIPADVAQKLGLQPKEV